MIFKKSATLQDVTPADGDRDTIGNGLDAISSPSISKKVQLVRKLMRRIRSKIPFTFGCRIDF